MIQPWNELKCYMDNLTMPKQEKGRNSSGNQRNLRMCFGLSTWLYLRTKKPNNMNKKEGLWVKILKNKN